MQYFMFFASLCIVAFTASAQPQHAGIFSVPGGTGDDGCQANYRTTQSVVAYSEPSSMSDHIRTVDANRRVDWNDRSEALTVVIQPAIFRATERVTLHGVSENASSPATIHISEGNRVEVLAYAGEGDSYFRVNGDVFVGYAPGIGDVTTGLNDSFELETEPIVEVWVRLIDHGGKPRAWVNVSQPGVEPYSSYCR